MKSRIKSSKGRKPKNHILFKSKLFVFFIAFFLSSKLTHAIPNSPEVNEISQSVLRGKYGQMSPKQLVNIYLLAEGETLYDVHIAHVLRKQEVLPVIIEKLQECSPIEKRKITKLLRYAKWAEVTPYLLDIALSDEEHELSRIGALYALGSIGNKSVGNDILSLLDKPDRAITEKRIIIATLARLKHKASIPNIHEYLSHEDFLMRLYATRALSELGEDVDGTETLSALDNDNYVIRQEACSSLASTKHPDAEEILDEISKNDHHKSVRRTAKFALANLKISKMSNEDKTILLETLIQDPDNKVKRWAINALATKCNDEGKVVLNMKASSKTQEGKQAIYELIISSVKEDK